MKNLNIEYIKKQLLKTNTRARLKILKTLLKKTSELDIKNQVRLSSLTAIKR